MLKNLVVRKKSLWNYVKKHIFLKKDAAYSKKDV